MPIWGSNRPNTVRQPCIHAVPEFGWSLLELCGWWLPPVQRLARSLKPAPTDELGQCALASFGHVHNSHLGTRPSTL